MWRTCTQNKIQLAGQQQATTPVGPPHAPQSSSILRCAAFCVLFQSNQCGITHLETSSFHHKKVLLEKIHKGGCHAKAVDGLIEPDSQSIETATSVGRRHWCEKLRCQYNSLTPYAERVTERVRIVNHQRYKIKATAFSHAMGQMFKTTHIYHIGPNFCNWETTEPAVFIVSLHTNNI